MQNKFRKILKKHYKKNLEIIAKIQDEINQSHNLIEKEIGDCYTAELNEYYLRLDCEIKLGSIGYCWLEDSAIYRTASDKIKMILEKEFDDDRLGSAVEHCNDYIWSNIEDDFEDENIEIKYKDAGRGDTGIEVSIDLSQLEEIVEYEIDAIEQLRNYRDYNLENAVDNQKRLLKEFRKAKNKIKKEIKTIKSLVESSKIMLSSCSQDQLESDIQYYLEENLLIIQKRVDEIKFDHIVEIKDNKIKTNKQAIVDLDGAKDLLKRFLAGENIINQFINGYKILKVFDIKNIIFVRIGCHLIKIDKNLINQLEC